ncbi:MAG: WbqC family protein, partial [Bacteroidota bacterium]
DEIHPFFEKKWNYLLDYNLKINEVICDLLEIENNVILTDDFEKVPPKTFNLREIISPKNYAPKDAGFHPEPYTQVFSEKFDFIPNLSILDLLFNEGPNSYSILENSIK